MGSLTVLKKKLDFIFFVVFLFFFFWGRDGNVDLGRLGREYDRVHCMKLPNGQYNMLEKKTCVNCKILPI